MSKFIYKQGDEKHEFLCPEDVYRGSMSVILGEYAGPAHLMPKLHAPIVLDIGGNVGAYACYAAMTWPGAKIHSYEPHPSNLEYLKQNVPEGVEVHPVAVTDKYGSIELHEGSSNCGCHSIYDVGEQTSKVISVDTIPASTLPFAHVVKIDTEGCEYDILRDYPHLEDTRLVCFEWHRNADKWKCGGLLVSRGFKCVAEKPHAVTPDRGVLIFTKEAVR